MWRLFVFFLLPQFGGEAEGGVELEHGGDGQCHFPLTAPKGEQAKGGDEQQTSRDHEEAGAEHLLAAQAPHRDVAPFVALHQLERAEEERTGAKHVGSEV